MRSEEVLAGGEEYRELEKSISGVRHSCKFLKYSCGACLIIFSVAWISLLGIMIASIVVGQVDHEGVKGVLYVLFYGLVIEALLYDAFQSFSDIVSGESPFTTKQVFRFRFASLLLLFLAVIDAALSTGFIYYSNVMGISFGAMGNDGVGGSQISINAMALFFAAMLYGVSVLFRYGALLQRLTDETD